MARINHDLEEIAGLVSYVEIEEKEDVKMNGGNCTAQFRNGRQLVRVKVRSLLVPSQISYQTPLEGSEDDTKTSQWSDIQTSNGTPLQINMAGNVTAGITYLQETDAFKNLPEEFRFSSLHVGEIWLELWYRKAVGHEEDDHHS